MYLYFYVYLSSALTPFDFQLRTLLLFTTAFFFVLVLACTIIARCSGAVCFSTNGSSCRPHLTCRPPPPFLSVLLSVVLVVCSAGVKFGLSGGRVESIMVSAPPLVSWTYNHVPEEGSEEDRLLQILRTPREWAL